MRKTVYLKSKKVYIAVKYVCTERENIGLIEKPPLGFPNGTLNAKPALISDITVAGGNFQSAGFYVAIHGKTRRGAGTGYAGWRETGQSIDDAIAYLSQYFDVQFCDAATGLDIDFARKGYTCREWDSENGKRVYYKKGSDAVIVIPKITVKSSSPADIDTLFKKIQAELQDILNKGFNISDLYLPGGGTIPLPDWFKNWCLKNGIRIHMMDVGGCTLPAVAIG